MGENNTCELCTDAPLPLQKKKRLETTTVPSWEHDPTYSAERMTP